MPDEPRVSLRLAALATLALLVGLAIGYLDSQPSWDDTAVTVGLLVIAAAVVAGIAGERPWVWALLVGAPLPIIEVPATGSWAPLVGLLFAAIGASIGLIVRRGLGSRAPAT